VNGYQKGKHMSIDLQDKFQFDALAGRHVECDFSGGYLSSDGGLLLLRQMDLHLGLSGALAGCFHDLRDQRFVEHELPELIAQRVIGISAGYEDLNDHNDLRRDPMMATAAGKSDPTGMDRMCDKDKGQALAGASTLNRLELGNTGGDECYRKIRANMEDIEDLLIDFGVQALSSETTEVVLDFDATDDLIHGMQEGRFFNGYYDNYCYLPLYCFAGSIPLWAQLRTSDQDACNGTVEALEKIVPAIRRRFPKARIIVRGDSGFCRDEIMVWCETHEVFYCFGLAPNARLHRLSKDAMFRARITACLVGRSTRVFTEFDYKTLDSWSCSRRVIAKAEVLPEGENPRFIVTSLPQNGFDSKHADRFLPAACYEQFYCARGDMENRIKEQQMDLFADRTSTHHMDSNQLRLWFATFAYFLIERIRTLTLHGTKLAKATAGTIRLKLFKIAANFTISCRRIYVRLASACPMRKVFATSHQRLMALSRAFA